MPGFLFFDPGRRLCMTIDDETVRPGDHIRAVVWMTEDQQWGQPTQVPYERPARRADLSDGEVGALDRALRHPGLFTGEIRPLYLPGIPGTSRGPA
jgi:hypothetical protein